MAATRYLAMTGAEFSGVNAPHAPIAWMACHFSPYSSGISNLPPCLPSGSLLMLNDWIPICHHDPGQIVSQLQQTLAGMNCAGVLLDFQKPDIPALQELATLLTDTLPCPVAVAEAYAQDLSCPVFLSPCPHHIHLSEHIAPWKGREMWLDLAVDAESITLSEKGAVIMPLPLGEIPTGGHWEQELHCHYSIDCAESSACFTLWRTLEDLEALAKESENLGIRTTIGLYQEFCKV